MRHLVTVWNPLYSREVEQHLSVLLDWAARYDEKRAKADELYVWWGKVKSPNRQQPLVRAPDLEAMAQELSAADDSQEAHLYVTDYRSLYVGELLAIHEPVLPAAEREHVPAYYGERDLKCDFWFKLGDLRLLVRDDLPTVAEELQKLHNVHYNDRPVSLYGGMVDIPLVVTRPDGTLFFDPHERDIVTDGRLWVEYDAELGGGLGQVQRELRDNLLGDDVWASLDWTVRTAIASAEQIYREHRADSGFDFAPVILGFAKALEIQTNTILRRAAAKLPAPLRTVNVDGRSVDLANGRPLSLGELAHAIGSGKELNDGLIRLLKNGMWFAGQLPAILDGMRDLRNPAAHSKRITRDDAARLRNRLLGVGSKGVLVELAEVALKS